MVRHSLFWISSAILPFCHSAIRLSTSHNAQQLLDSFHCILLNMNIILLICRPLEQVAMDRLVELAHRKQLVCCLSPLFIPYRAEFTSLSL
jgi:hypothetical protein